MAIDVRCGDRLGAWRCAACGFRAADVQGMLRHFRDGHHTTIELRRRPTTDLETADETTRMHA